MLPLYLALNWVMFGVCLGLELLSRWGTGDSSVGYKLIKIWVELDFQQIQFSAVMERVVKCQESLDAINKTD